MRSIISITAAVILLVAALGCAPSVKKQPFPGGTIGIVNEFPEAPNYIKKRTFVFRHQKTALDPDIFKDSLTRSASEFLESKGYRTVMVDDTSALKDGRADMVIRIQPMDIHKHADTLGYGFYDRRFLEVVLKQPARSYVCMNVSLHQKGRAGIRKTGRQENFRKLDFPELPDTPEQLTETHRRQMSENLEVNIRDTVTTALTRLGF